MLVMFFMTSTLTAGEKLEIFLAKIRAFKAKFLQQQLNFVFCQVMLCGKVKTNCKLANIMMHIV